MSAIPPPSPLDILSTVAANSPRMESPASSSAGSSLPARRSFSPPLNSFEASFFYGTSLSPVHSPIEDVESQETVKQEDFAMDIAESSNQGHEDQDSDSDASNSKPTLRPRPSKGKSRYQVSTSDQGPSTSQSTSGSAKRKRVTGRKNLSGQDRRKAYLDNDPFAELQNEFCVKCTACENNIKLDQRGGRAYYSQFWLKHRDACKKIPVKQRIEMLEEDQRRSQKLPTKREKKLEQLRATYAKEQQSV